jgi:hypothetical protein
MHLYFLNGMNLVRFVFKDKDEDNGKDWFRPLIMSMLIDSEHTYRKKLGLPTLLPNDVVAIMHSTFMNIVAGGVGNSLFQWEDSYKRPHPYKAT